MLPQTFFDGGTVEIARSLVGKYLVRQYGGITLAARVTETEAYIGRMDKACHAYNYRKTERTKTLHAPPGTAYVYLIYGMHCCLNFVTEPEGEPAAVLIRGLSPPAQPGYHSRKPLPLQVRRYDRLPEKELSQRSRQAVRRDEHRPGAERPCPTAPKSCSCAKAWRSWVCPRRPRIWSRLISRWASASASTTPRRPSTFPGGSICEPLT